MRSRTDGSARAAHRAFQAWATVLAVLLVLDVATTAARHDAFSLSLHAALAMALAGVTTTHYAVRRRLVVRELAIARSEGDLTEARARVAAVLTDRAVDVALQPIVDVTEGNVVGVEALSRFRDGRPPDVWFREAVDAGLGLELDQTAFLAALDLFAELPPHCFLSINATPELLNDRRFRQLLLNAEIPADRVVIEITEHERVASYEELGQALVPLRKRGARLAVDDTGAGYASLSHVLELRPDIIKLDRSLVANLSEDPARRALVTALVLLALELDATVTAEGVETRAELETLATLGVDHAQGYLLARPTTDRRVWQSWWSPPWIASTG